MSFDSYYWHDAPAVEPELEHARAELVSDDAADAEASFLVLLSSTRLAARCIALDHYHYAEASSRFGPENPFHAHQQQVLNTARALLEDPPVARGFEGAEVDGANHASALGAMLNLAGPEDASRVAAALATAPNHVVRQLAMQCAGTILESSQAPTVLSDTVRRVVDDPGVSEEDRGEALHLLVVSAPDDAVRLATELVRSPSVRIQANAAWLLAEQDLDRYRTLLTDVVSSWPEAAPYPAFEVRQLLDG